MYAGYLALHATLAGVRGHGPCARIRCSALLHIRTMYTCIHARVRALIRYHISPVVHDARCTCSFRVRVSRAQKPRARASSRSRMLGMRLPRSATNREMDERKREIHSVSFSRWYFCNLLVILLETGFSGGFVRYRLRSYANKLRGALYRAADHRASRLCGITLFSWSSERVEPVPPRVSRWNVKFKRNTRT